MNVKSHAPDNIYTQQIKRLINLVYPQEAGYESIFEDATHFFKTYPDTETHLSKLKKQKALIEGVNSKMSRYESLTREINKITSQLEKERLDRLTRLHFVAYKIIELSESDTHQETLQYSARFLGTLMLLTKGAEGNFARLHQRLKPLYKAVLTLRLADRLLDHEAISHKYLSKYREAAARFNSSNYWKDKWKTELGTPLIVAALLQNVGLHSSPAQKILKGEDGTLDEFRLLEDTQRQELLKLNYHFTLKYLNDGLGLPTYIGNSKEERDRFNQIHQDANDFLHQLVKDAFLSKSGLGELIKIPQIYVSIVLSTKSDYSRKNLPKGYLLIQQLAKKGRLNKQLAQDFINLVGYFPQGFGITYIPENQNGKEKDHYECAIVTGLSPADPAEPICKVVSRNLTYINGGNQEVISKKRNLYFPANRKKLMRVGKERLSEIMSQLSSDFSAEAIDDLVPSFWEPHDFFSYKKNQNLWNKNN